MKKYFMLIITIFMLVLTTAAYRYENNVEVPQFKQPSISIESQRFGTIKKIVWTNKYMNDNKALIILSERNSEQGVVSCLYRLDSDTSKSDLLAQFPAHKNLNDIVLFDAPMGHNSIIAAYDKGIVRVSYGTDKPSTPSQEMIEIAGFDTATSMDFKGNLVYTRENDNMLYVKNLSVFNFGSFFNGNAVKDITTYYTKPLYIGNLNSLDNMISYTSAGRNGINLFAMKNGAPVTKLNAPIIKNVVSVRGIEDSFGFAGMNILNSSSNNKKLNLFMLRRTIDRYNDDDYYSLDTIPYNTDIFGAVPAFDSETYNQAFTLAYTSYDENHKGSIKMCGLNEQPKVILSDETMFGPISITQTFHDNTDSTYILYFTLENNNVRIKICNGRGDLVKDITDMMVKNSSI